MATNELLIEKLKEKIKHLESYDSLCDFDQLKAWFEKKHQLESEIATLESLAKEPTDYDIENASVDYLDEENNHFAKQAKKAAYQQGAKDMRDGNIYISPESSNQIKG